MKKERLLAVALGAFAAFPIHGMELEEGFREPPSAAKPQVWWHWMAGNVTREGITADLEAMAEVGIGGAILFDAGLGTRWGVPEGTLDFNTPQWYETVRFAAQEAKRLGLELGIANCSGWANSGGPWNTPYHAMKRVCFTSTVVKGGKIAVELPQPEDPVGFYGDIAIVAFPTPKGEFTLKDWDFKCFSNRGRKYIEKDGRVAPEDAIVRRKDIRNLIGDFRDGRLECELPGGDWTILRVGYRALGQSNGTGTRLGKGLECDKLSKEALRIHWANYVEKTVKALGPELAGPNGSLRTVLNDSYESGSQNWTHGFERMFARHAGYDIVSWLPALCGNVVDSVEATEAFYRDFRLAVTDAFVSNYAGEMRRLAHACGLQLAIEPYGEIPADDLLYGEQADIPTAEFWAKINSPHWVRQAASIAHAKGRKIVAAESFTTNAREGRWQNTPWSMKAKCDWVYSEGLNRIIYHRFAHQPWTSPARLPGMTMGPFGVHFDRTQTWWKQAKPWLKYQQRCQFLLQEGEFAADVAWYCPTGYLYINWGRNPHKMPEPVPPGFAYDFISDTSLAAMRVEGGALVLPSGQKYRTVILPEKEFELLPTSAALVERLREAGADILSFEQAKDRLATRTPDVAWDEQGGKINWIHRRNDRADWYFVASADKKPRRVTLRFRQAGRVPELWNPETGEIVKVPFAVQNGVTVIPMTFGPCGSWFVMFGKAAKGDELPEALPPGRKSDEVFSGAFKVLRAEYGVFDDAALPPKDVTDKLAGLVKDGRLFYDRIHHDSFKIADPALNRVKSLRVTYLLDGEERVACVRERGILQIPEPDFLLDLPGRQVATRKIAGPWNLEFPVDWYSGGKTVKAIELDGLKDWTALPDADMKYFSGTAVYKKTIGVETFPQGVRLVLDLGDVREFADVMINGKRFDTLWKPPFRLDITELAASSPTLELVVRVTNLWPNRIIGDDFKAEDCTFEPGKPLMERRLNGWPQFILEGRQSPSGKHTFATWKHWTRDDALLPSGLLGPVVIRLVE
ncbi:MAG: glycosyl hydrolase [Kiritimatiellia bacterium]